MLGKVCGGSRGVSAKGRPRCTVRPGDAGCALRSFRGEDRAQATLEYALVLGAFLAMVIGFAAVWRAASEGTFAGLVEEASSHTLDAEGAVDIALY